MYQAIFLVSRFCCVRILVSEVPGLPDCSLGFMLKDC